MPEYLHQLWPNGTEARVWHIVESEEFFLDQIKWPKNELDLLSTFHPKRRLEYVASRYLLYKYHSDVSPSNIIKDEFGKLVLKDGLHKISISHSGNYTAFVKSPAEVGIDLQLFQEKILQIYPKFIHPNDFLYKDDQNQPISISSATLVWCAKEAVYKAHGKRNIHFKEQIRLLADIVEGPNGTGCVSLILPEEIKLYQIYYEIHAEFVWLVAILMDDL
jgi:phosphopantetheinyl transferase